MIPKKIHYCWFGGNPLPKSAIKCINSWKKYCPDYEIIEWNEQKFDISSAPRYVREAYEHKKYAFVSDYVRLYAMYNHGGIYMDTDVEVIKALDTVLQNDTVFGFEEGEFIATSFMASTENNSFIKEFMELYNDEIFVKSDGSLNTKTNVERLTPLLKRKGLKKDDSYQILNGSIAVYPKDYFSPFDNATGVLNKTANTLAIHWFDKSWVSFSERLRSKITRPFHRIFGVDCFDLLKK